MLADGTFKVLPSFFFQLYTMHSNSFLAQTLILIDCLEQNKTQALYARTLDEIKRMTSLANSEKILLDFKSAAVNAFRAAYPNATILGCYFHLTQSILRKSTKLA